MSKATPITGNNDPDRPGAWRDEAYGRLAVERAQRAAGCKCRPGKPCYDLADPCLCGPPPRAADGYEP